VKQINGSVARIVAALMASAILLTASFTSAQNAEPSANAKSPVPANLSPHPGPVQPIPYSHKFHLSMSLPCQQCHTNPEPGALMTFPTTATCMQCHSTVGKDKPAIQKLAEFAKSQQPIPWVRVYKVLPGTGWSHRKHLQAGAKCTTCHGQVADLEVMAEVTGVTAMSGCIDCHKAFHAKTTCNTCHSWYRETETSMK
jgi:Cytochrome c7 and related cytochrome c/Class III cytochrome C family